LGGIKNGYEKNSWGDVYAHFLDCGHHLTGVYVW
jgi:hypothetical protein